MSAVVAMSGPIERVEDNRAVRHPRTLPAFSINPANPITGI
jgi:hypothetical protein